MAIKIKVNNDDTSGLNKKWIRNSLLILGLAFTLIGLVHIFCIAVKPNGYEKIVFILGDHYIQQLFFGALFLTCFYVIKNSKPVNSN